MIKLCVDLFVFVINTYNPNDGDSDWELNQN